MLNSFSSDIFLSSSPMDNVSFSSLLCCCSCFWSHERPGNFLERAGDISQNGIHPASADCRLLLYLCRCAGQLREVFRRLQLVRLEGVHDMAVGRYGLILAVTDFLTVQLGQILTDQIEADPVAGQKRQRFLNDFKLSHTGELIHHHEQLMLVSAFGSAGGTLRPD